jgi:hypothetical protein
MGVHAVFCIHNIYHSALFPTFGLLLFSIHSKTTPKNMQNFFRSELKKSFFSPLFFVNFRKTLEIRNERKTKEEKKI